MDAREAVMLSAYVENACPQQKFNEFTGEAWGDLLADVRYVDALEAVKTLGKKQPFISPSEIIAEVRVVRSKRIADEVVHSLHPPADLDPDDPKAYIAWLSGAIKALGDGEPPREFGELRERPLRAIEGAFRRVPRDEAS